MATMQTYDGFSPKINKIKEDNANNMHRAQPRQNTTNRRKFSSSIKALEYNQNIIE